MLQIWWPLGHTAGLSTQAGPYYEMHAKADRSVAKALATNGVNGPWQHTFVTPPRLSCAIPKFSAGICQHVRF